MDYRLRGGQQEGIVFVPALVRALRLRLPFFRFWEREIAGAGRWARECLAFYMGVEYGC